MGQHCEQASRKELWIAVVGLWTILIVLSLCFWFRMASVPDERTILPITKRPSWVRVPPFPDGERTSL
jgi:hypothetical protein